MRGDAVADGGLVALAGGLGDGVEIYGRAGGDVVAGWFQIDL
ncbi:MAG: hypothetical protein WEC37_02585 [Anaerolineales bacterium]